MTTVQERAIEKPNNEKKLTDGGKVEKGNSVILQLTAQKTERVRAMRLIDADALKLEELSTVKNCKHTTGSKLKCSKFNEIQMSGLHFCSYGEREEDCYES